MRLNAGREACEESGVNEAGGTTVAAEGARTEMVTTAAVAAAAAAAGESVGLGGVTMIDSAALLPLMVVVVAGGLRALVPAAAAAASALRATSSNLVRSCSFIWLMCSLFSEKFVEASLESAISPRGSDVNAKGLKGCMGAQKWITLSVLAA
jgi:hypothetical protein